MARQLSGDEPLDELLTIKVSCSQKEALQTTADALKLNISEVVRIAVNDYIAKSKQAIYEAKLLQRKQIDADLRELEKELGVAE